MDVRTSLDDFLKRYNGTIIGLGRREGTALITKCTEDFALENGIKLKSEVHLNFGFGRSGRLDFVLYYENLIYPIEVDNTAKKDP